MASPAKAGWRIERATAIAEKVWHHPCVDEMHIGWTPPAGTTEATAWSFEAPDCEIWFRNDEKLSWPEFCTYVLHEAGHLAHYRDPSHQPEPWHSSNPRSIMYAVHGFDRVLKSGRLKVVGGDPRCAARGRPFLSL